MTNEDEPLWCEVCEDEPGSEQDCCDLILCESCAKTHDGWHETRVSEGFCACGQLAQKHTKTCPECAMAEAEYLLETDD